MPGPLIVLGDETSIGLAYSIYQQDPAGAVCCLLEVNAADNTRALLARLALGSAGLFERRADDAHLHDLESCLPALSPQRRPLYFPARPPRYNGYAGC